MEEHDFKKREVVTMEESGLEKKEKIIRIAKNKEERRPEICAAPKLW